MNAIVEVYVCWCVLVEENIIAYPSVMSWQSCPGVSSAEEVLL